ncbi:MAG: DUF3365 domain-containing protein [Actinobacteria bacterium]|nr:DUF3365 domain-containing protein [Actinomycetota bacterium]
MLKTIRNRYTRAARYATLLAVCWTAIMVVIYFLSASEIDQQAEDEAVTRASVVWEKDVLYRRWNASHGGVYVPVSAQTPSNPYLTQIPERDIVTPSGKQLTLMNPAYMTRQVNELAAAEGDVFGHITSLNPIRPGNAADQWETTALRAFDEGQTEVTSIEQIDGQPYLRLMRPMVTEKPCLKCHAGQGYQEGDIRGGVSISIPFSQVAAHADSQKKQAGIIYSLIWLTGCAGISLGAVRQRRGELELRRSRDDLEVRVKERTGELQDANRQLQVELTERRHAEETLSESEQQFKEAQQIAQIGNWDWDAVTDATFWSEELYHILNFDPAKPSPNYKEHLRIYTPESAARLNASVEETMKTGEPYELDLELSQPDATRRWIVARGEVKHDTTGAITGLRGTAQNITERITAEASLKEALKLAEDEKEKNRAIIEGIGDGISIQDTDLKVLFQNQVHRDFIGDHVGEYCYNGYEKRDGACEGCPVAMAMADGKIHFTERTVVFPDGNHYFEITASPLRNSEGEIIGGIEAVREVTDRKKSEVERRSLRAQLLQAQKMEAVGRLAGGIAHDINNFLTVIEGYTDLVLTELPEESAEYGQLLESRKASESAANLARQLLIFSRQEAMHPAPTNLNALITDAMKMLRRLIGERYMLTTDLAPDLKTVSADKSHIQQVIMNLAVNARDAMPDGGKIEIRSENFPVDRKYAEAHADSREGEFVRISVRDEGSGMDAETIAHMYEPFFTTKGAAQGTGLGLSVVYGIISHHEGWVDVESDPGRGSTLYFFLPVIPLTEEDTVKEVTPPAQLTGRGEKILLVEDEDTVRKLAERILVKAGYAVTTAASAEEALSLFDEARGDFDLVFSDVVLPQENGIMLVDRLLKKKAGLRVLLASGYSEIEWQENIHEREYPFLQKPYSREIILKKIWELLNES